MIVDSNMTNFKDIVGENVKKYLPQYKEFVIVAYYDEADEYHLEVKSDQDLLDMFAKYVGIAK